MNFKTYCEHCNCNEVEEKCCWLKGIEIIKFKRRVLHSYIIEPIFDMVVSTISVVLDIITLIHYMTHKKWALAVLTSIPVLLPTTVFTNVYMSNGKKSNLNKKYENSEKEPSRESQSRDRMFSILEGRIESAQKLSIFNCIGCLSGTLHSLFHKDRRIRKRGSKLARKSFRRSAKYIFGTLVLRFIAWSWYLKALLFGIKSFRNPKRFMKMEQPDSHWTRELLIRLDFLQAALENAPQCVIQLYTLLTDSSENSTLGLMTLAFSFIDFVRVVSTVFWNVNKGPVVAPEGSYGKRLWKILNISSWVLIYTARCAAVALIVGTAAASKNWIYAVPIVALILHIAIFSKLFSYRKLGQASEKLWVTIFISIFFLPELDSKDVHVIVQFYYALILLENTIFTLPLRGFSFPDYCLVKPSSRNETSGKGSSGLFASLLQIRSSELKASESSEENQDCLIEPWLIAFLVPAFTITGSVIRLTAYQKMATFRKTSGKTKPDRNKATMEERVAKIYNKKWTTMSPREMWRGLTRMLRKEEEMSQLESSAFRIRANSPNLGKTENASKELMAKYVSAFYPNNSNENERSILNTDKIVKGNELCKNGSGMQTFPPMRSGLKTERKLTIKTIFRQRLFPESNDDREACASAAGTENDNKVREILETLDVRFLRISTTNGTRNLQMVDI